MAPFATAAGCSRPLPLLHRLKQADSTTRSAHRPGRRAAAEAADRRGVAAQVQDRA